MSAGRLLVALVTAALTLPVPGLSAEADGAGAAGLPELTVERQESWLARELRRLRTFPHLDRAYRLEREGRWVEARRELETVLRLDPDDLEARYAYLLLLSRTDDHAEVVRQADALLAARPGFAPARLYRGLARHHLGQADAVEDFRAAAEAPGTGLDDRRFALEMWADLALAAGRKGEAAAAQEHLAALGEDGFAYHFRGGLLDTAEGRHDTALEAFWRALRRAPGPAERLHAQRAIAEAATRLGDAATARTALEAAHELAPEDVDILRSLAHAATQTGDHPAALAWLREALARQPRPGDRERLAHVLLAAGEVEGAAAELGRVLAEASTDAERFRVQLALGHVWERAGRPARAAEAFAAAAGLEERSEALAGLARALVAAGRPAAAVPHYQALLSRSPSAELHLDLGAALAASGDVEGAVRHLGQAATAADAGLRARAHRRLGYLLAGLARPAEARHHLEEALRLTSRGGAARGDADLYFALGEACNQLAAFDDAAAYLEAGLAIEHRPAGEAALAWAWAGAGRTTEAAELYRRLLGTPEPPLPAWQLGARLARLELAEGEPAAAARRFEDAAAAHPPAAAQLLAEATESWIAAGSLETARAANRRLLTLDLAPDARGAALLREGSLAARLGDDGAAAAALEEALVAGVEGAAVRQDLGSAYFRLGRDEEALTQFQKGLELAPDPRSRLYLARSYDRLGRSGTALYHLRQVAAELEGLEPQERPKALEELAFLLHQQASYEEADAVWQRRLALGATPEVMLRSGLTLARLGRGKEARERLSGIDPASLTPALEARRLEELGDLDFTDHDLEAAAERYLAAQAAEPSAERLYRLGLCYQRLKRPLEAAAWLARAVAAAPSSTRYLEAEGYALMAAGERDGAIASFEEVLARDQDYLRLYQDLAYLYLRQSDNRRAAEWFDRALDNEPLYPVRTREDQEELERTREQLRGELAKLRDRIDVSLYLAARSDALPTAGPAVLTGGALPSQAGIEVAFRPPRLGFRNERTLALFARVLADVRPDSLDPDRDSYQGGIGVRYKPLRSQNLLLSGERLVAIGDDSQDNWLLRALYSWNHGYAPRPGERHWPYTLLYLDLSYLVDAPRTWALFGEVRQGVTWNRGDRLLLTPHLMVAGRYEDPGGGLGSWIEGGGGLSLKAPLGSARPLFGASFVELLLQYRAGRFVETGGEITDDSFDGFVATTVVLF